MVPKAVFYVPHPDDETLSMGVAIVNHLFAGNDVYVVLLTHGRASNAFNVLNGTANCAWHCKTHNPEAEGYSSFDRTEFGFARIREFVEAVKALGVPESNMEIHNLEDGQVTVDQVKAVIRTWEIRFPGIKHKTMTYHDDHPDHANAGRALLELYNAGIVSDARFYIKRTQYDQTGGAFEYCDLSYHPYIHSAANAYMTWNPDQGRLAVGYHSVKAEFDALLGNPRSKFHKPGQ